MYCLQGFRHEICTASAAAVLLAGPCILWMTLNVPSSRSFPKVLHDREVRRRLGKTFSRANVVYAMQGLFHPARKVREVYWRLYNNLYIGAQDALVGCYPRLEDDGINTYNRQELDVFF